MFTNKKRERVDTFVCAVSLFVTETPKVSIKDQELQLPITPLILSRTVLLDSLCRNSCRHLELIIQLLIGFQRAGFALAFYEYSGCVN